MVLLYGQLCTIMGDGALSRPAGYIPRFYHQKKAGNSEGSCRVVMHAGPYTGSDSPLSQVKVGYPPRVHCTRYCRLLAIGVILAGLGRDSGRDCVNIW